MRIALHSIFLFSDCLLGHSNAYLRLNYDLENWYLQRYETIQHRDLLISVPIMQTKYYWCKSVGAFRS